MLKNFFFFIYLTFWENGTALIIFMQKIFNPFFISEMIQRPNKDKNATG